MDPIDQQKLLRRLSELESLSDQLQAELRYLDGLLKDIGFEEGLVSLKKAAEELRELNPENPDNPDD